MNIASTLSALCCGGGRLLRAMAMTRGVRREDYAAAGPGLGVLLCMTLYSVLSLAGCSSQPPQPAIQVPLSDIQAVAGEWEGSVRTTPDKKLKASLLLIINENSAYTFVSEDAAAIGLGAGILTIENGVLVSSSQGRQVRMALYERNGRQILAGAVRSAKGEDLLVEVMRRNTSNR